MSSTSIHSIGSVITAPPKAAQSSQGMTLQSLMSSLTISIVMFAMEVACFLLLRSRLTDLYQPRVSIGEGVRPNMSGTFSWIRPAITTSNEDILEACGLDAFFFLRYLRTILKLFIPLAAIELPILLPLNIVHGKGSNAGVQGLDQLTWAGVGFAHSSYYWAHFVIAVVFVTFFCYVLYQEFLYYIQIRHRALASISTGNTVFISGIPAKLRSVQALSTLYGDIGARISTVWLNRDYKVLYSKLQERDLFIARLESAETEVIRSALGAFAKSRSPMGHDNATGKEKENRLISNEINPRQLLRHQNRQTMRLPIHKWMTSIPLLGKKVDVITYCRGEIARLNVEIETQQSCPNAFPTLDSAFIQFKSPVDAHLVCQSVAHHTPFCLTAEHVFTTPESVIWRHVGIRWWEHYIRTLVVLSATVVLIGFWTVPVAFTGILSQLSYLKTVLPWLKNVEPSVFGVVQGVIPQVLLIILTSQLPNIIRLLIAKQGFIASANVETAVQRSYFWFLFTQVFLTVALSSSVTTLLENIYHGFDSVPATLATHLPKSSNYFLSYLLLHAFSMSAGELAQVFGLIQRYAWSPLVDKTPRQKWKRNSLLSVVQWGSIYPVYTNLACIGVVYSIIAPLITLFVVIAFGLFWLAFRHNVVYVVKSLHDSGGLLYPIALNQLFTGIYIFEICLTGLFFLVRDEGKWCCIGQATLMIIATALTVAYQILLNQSLSPLLRFLPMMYPHHFKEQLRARTMGERGSSADSLSSDVDCLPAPFCDKTLAEQAVVWLPRDPLGLSDIEISETKQTSDKILISDKGSSINMEGRINGIQPPNGNSL